MSPASTSKFTTQTYVFDPRPAYPLQLVAKRYFVPNSNPTGSLDSDAPTLVFAHGTGFHKELWEPVIDDLAVLVDGQVSVEGRVRVRDIWAVDCPNHGDSAALNPDVLKYGFESIFNWEEYGRILHLFINGHGRLTQTGGVNDRGDNSESYTFMGHNVIGIGHSMGSVALALSLTYAPSPTNSFTPHPHHPIKSLILVETMILHPTYALGTSSQLVAGADRRKDMWPSRKEAGEALGRSLKRQGWEARCLKNYVQYGLKPVAVGASDGNTGEDGPVTLKCTREQEAACYRDPLGPLRLYASFGALVGSLPVHAVYGAMDDYLPPAVKADVIENQAGGAQNFASFAWVPGGGHLVPFQNPTGLAEKIFDALRVQARADTDARASMSGAIGKAKL